MAVHHARVCCCHDCDETLMLCCWDCLVGGNAGLGGCMTGLAVICVHLELRLTAVHCIHALVRANQLCLARWFICLDPLMSLITV